MHREPGLGPRTPGTPGTPKPTAVPGVSPLPWVGSGGRPGAEDAVPQPAEPPRAGAFCAVPFLAPSHRGQLSVPQLQEVLLEHLLPRCSCKTLQTP